MKIKYLALAIGLAATSAFAAEVTLYGIIETGPVVQKQRGKAVNVNLSSAFDLGSRWGFRGVEDLGNGNSVGFVLENGFDPSTGNTTIGGSGAMFGRESSMYYRNNSIGRIGFGRIPTLWSGLGSFDMEVGWVYKGGYGLSAWPAIGRGYPGNFSRVNNSVVFQSEFFSGWRVGLMYSNSDGNNDDNVKWSESVHYYGATVQYKDGPINSGIAFEMEGNHGVSTGDGDLNNPNAGKKYMVNFGIEYDLGWATPMFRYRWHNQSGGYKLHSFGLSGIIPAFGGRFKPGVRYTFGKTENPFVMTDTDKIQNLIVSVAYEYPLSKRTVLKPYVGYAWSGKAWHDYEPTDANVVYNGYQIYLGMHHFF